jgi:hypothetical protein
VARSTTRTPSALTPACELRARKQCDRCAAKLVDVIVRIVADERARLGKPTLRP